MEKEIYLKLDTEYGVITIPFKGLENVDKFTVIYPNMAELVNNLIKILKLKIDLYDVTAIYLTEDKYKLEMDEECLPVKYSKDNFNNESLQDAFVEYIKADQNRILTTDMRFVRTREILKYFETRYIDTYEIERAVRAFFKDTGYKRKRSAYFMIQGEDGISIKIDKLPEKTVPERENLSQYSKEEDDYLSHLIELSQREPEMLDKVMDEIAQSDLEDIAGLLKKDGYGIVDGASDAFVSKERQKELLEQNTGISIAELREKHTSFGRKRKPR